MASDILVKIGADITDFSRKMAESQKALSKFTQENQATFDAFKKTGAIVTSFGVGIASGLGYASKQAIDFESSFAGVRKTVDASEEEFAVLEKGIRNMAKELPASVHEINAVAEAAGQLGIEKESILGFTRTMIDLGEATNMTSDVAAESLARFANITQMSQKDFDRLGSSIVELGNNFATTEADIVAMSMRLAGAGTQVGMSEADILALATALSSVGIEAEMGGSALSRVMVNMQVATSTGFKKVQEVLKETGQSLRDLEMIASHDAESFGEIAYSLGMTKKELKDLIKAGKDLEGFSKVAGMTGDQFVQAFEKDAIGAMGAFIEGLANAEAQGESAINMLQEMGITEIRLRDSLLRAGGASKLFADAVKMSSEAWDENSALTDEAEQRYKTVASQLAMLKNTVIDAAISLGQTLLPAISSVTSFLKALIENFNGMSESSQKFIAFGSAIVGILSLIAGPILLLIGFIPQIIVGFEAIGTVLAALSGPVGWIILAIIGIGIALVTAYNKVDWFRNMVDEAWAHIKDAFFTAINWIKNSVVVPIMTEVSKFMAEILGKVRAFWDENGEAIMKLVKFYFENIRIYISFVMDVIKTVFGNAWTIISNVVRVVWGVIKLVISNAIDTVLGVIDVAMKLLQGDWKGAWESIKKTAESIWTNIKNFFKNVDLYQVGKDILNGLIKGIASMKDAAIKAVKNIGENIKKTFTSFFGIHSPSRVMMALAKHIPGGAIVGINSMVNKVKTATQRLSDAMLPDVPEVSMSYATPSGTYASLSSAVNGTVDVDTRDSMIAEAIGKLESKLENMRIELDGREFGRAVSDVSSNERNNAVRNGGRRRV